MVVILLVGCPSPPPPPPPTIDDDHNATRTTVNFSTDSNFPPRYDQRRFNRSQSAIDSYSNGVTPSIYHYNNNNSNNRNKNNSNKSNNRQNGSNKSAEYARTKRLSFSVPQLSTDLHRSPSKEPLDQTKNYSNNNNTPIIRHITKVNICDAFSQLEVGPDEAEAVTREEEVITKKKTELTTTKQIETRLKRQIVLEDGKVVEDSGPIVSTNTTEDTEKQESNSTERRNLGDPVEAIEDGNEVSTALSGPAGSSNVVSTVLSPRPDGLVREVKEKQVISREEVKELLETEDVQNLGEFSDETYLKAVNSGQENIKGLLFSPDAQKQLVPTGPRVVHHSTTLHKTIDTEDTDLQCLAQSDGKLVTEKKKTFEHEEIHEEDLPDSEDDGGLPLGEKVTHKEAAQRIYKQRDEQTVDYVKDGKVVDKEMRYVAETQEMERDGHMDPSDWDSLSDRIRKARRQGRTLMQQHKAAQLLGERKDAFTKRPLDFDKEEETRKLETTKWLESHFGSDSQSSRGSYDGDMEGQQFEQEPTKRSYFNVTIKSNTSPTNGEPPIHSSTPVTNGTRYLNGHSKIAMQSQKLSSPAKVHIPEREPPPAPQPPPTKYFQGVSNWKDRKEPIPKLFSNKAFHDELKGTVERKRLGKNGNNYVIPRDEEPSDESVKQYGRNSDLGYNSGSRNDLRYRKPFYEEDVYRSRPINGHKEVQDIRRPSKEDLKFRSMSNLHNRDERDDSAYVSSSTYFTSASPRSPKFLNKNPKMYRSESPEQIQEVRPVVPQRKRAMERKMKMMSAENHQDYVSRSRSPSPISMKTASTTNIHQKSLSYQPNGYNTLQAPAYKKAIPRTRFASEDRTTAPTHNGTSTSGKNKISSAIGNSIRKLVGKIRSVSAERKMKMKSGDKKSKSPNAKTDPAMSTATYQQYNNNIDHNIEHHHGVGVVVANDHKPLTHAKSLDSGRALLSNVETINGNGGYSDREHSISNDQKFIYDQQNGTSMIHSPKQRYYLGENPYGGSIFGRENKYDINSVRSQANRINNRKIDDDLYNNSRSSQLSTSVTTARYQQPSPNHNTSTLGRFSKSTHRLQPQGPTEMYRSVQTLPRKLEPRYEQSANRKNVTVINTHPLQNTGPAKPARTYKSLNRSKSFNVHGLNGHPTDYSPIYMEKLTNKNNLLNSNQYRSTSVLNDNRSNNNHSALGLKSPSIVNLVSRSQKDLSKINDEEVTYSVPIKNRPSTLLTNGGGQIDKKSLFLKGLQDQAPELYKTLVEEEKVRPYRTNFRESSIGSRSPVTINKDTASLIRRGSSSDDYSETYRYTTRNDDPRKPSVTNTVENYSRKTIPAKDGRAREVINKSDSKSVTTIRYNGK